METPRRTFAKALSWQCVGILSMIGLAYIHSSDIAKAVSLALSASATGFVFYFLHERVWSRIRWGRRLP